MQCHNLEIALWSGSMMLGSAHPKNSPSSKHEDKALLHLPRQRCWSFALTHSCPDCSRSATWVSKDSKLSARHRDETKHLQFPLQLLTLEHIFRIRRVILLSYNFRRSESLVADWRNSEDVSVSSKPSVGWHPNSWPNGNLLSVSTRKSISELDSLKGECVDKRMAQTKIEQN